MLNPFASFLASKRFRLGWILVLIGLANALFWTLYRWNFENHFRSTQIVCDFEDTRSMADGFGKSQEQLLVELHKRGVNSILLYEQTLSSLRDNARLVIQSREAAEQIYPTANWAQVPPQYRFLIVSDDAALLNQIYPRIFSQSVVPPQRIALRGGQGILISNSKQLVSDAQLGFDPQQLALAKRVNMIVAARIANPVNLTPKRITQLLDDVKYQAKANVVFMGDDQVVGFESLISPVQREMRKRDLTFTVVEFGKTRGAGDMAKFTEGKIARVHTVLPEEALGAEPELLVDRYVRAAKERNMRVLFLRLMRHQKGEPEAAEPGDLKAPIRLEKDGFDQNMELVEKVSTEIQRAPLPFFRPGLGIGPAQRFGDYPMAQLEQGGLPHRVAQAVRFEMLFVTGLGVVGMTLLLLNLFFDMRPEVQQRWFIAGVALVFALSFSAGIGAKLLALQAGLVCSTVGMMWGGLPLIWDGLKRPGSSRTPVQIAVFGLGVLFRTTLITLIGGLYVTAFLNNWRYMSKADEYLGEKATQFLPIAIIAFAFVGEIFPHRVEAEGAAPGVRRAMARLRGVVARPFTAQTAIYSLVVLAVGYVWMARFGNDSGMQISAFELKARATLEQVFLTRPRTKEISLGHPAFILMIAFLLRRQKLLALAALLPAIIGQTDVLNTMCHIHTPVFFNLWRSITGIVIGGFAGFVALLVVLPVLTRFTRPK
ncbi:hypothetical protein EON83_23885, partial [bacterium]